MTDNAKGGVLEGGSLTAEVIESSDSVLKQGKGLQQFYSPPEMAELVKHIAGPNQAVLDLTAGDGSLLAHIDEENRYGIEIDVDQIANAKTEKQGYTSVHGDVQQVVPILTDVNAKFPVLACNPPYGLKWSDPSFEAGREVNSALLTYEYALRLLEMNGTGVMLVGASSKWRDLKDKLPVHHARGLRSHVYAVLHVDDMFDNVQSSTDVICFGWVYDHSRELKTLELDVRREDLEGDEVNRALQSARQDTTFVQWRSPPENQVHLWMRAAQEEHSRRSGKRLARKSKYDIFGGKKAVQVSPRPYVSLKLAGSRALDTIKSYDRQPLEYFVLNHKAWKSLLEMEEQGTIAIEPALVERIAKLALDRERDIVPMYTLKKQQRLAYLEDEDKVLCTESYADDRVVFNAGESYPIAVRTIIQQEREKARPVQNKKTGDIVLKDYLKERKCLDIRIGGKRYSETKDDIEFIINHFAIPNPGTVADRYPEECEANRVLLTSYEANASWKFKPFQKEDLARLLVKKSGLLAWEQGLGKTLAGLTFAKGCVDLGAQEQVLFVVPQDLIKQWRKEAKRFYGIELTWLRSRRDFLACRAKLRAGGTGWYITHYEALSRAGRIEERVEMDSMKVKYEIEEVVTSGGCYEYSEEKRGAVWIEPVLEKVRRTVTDATHCPGCAVGYNDGYNPNKGCDSCGWSRYRKRVKPQADFVKSCFRHGVLVVDELTKMKGESERSRAVRGIKAAHVLGMTGTPIKNYIPDSFWGLWKSLGDASPRFPYAYSGGKTRYENDFAVVEWQLGGWGRKENRKVLPEITNVSRLWRLLSASIIRKRKEETGEKLVARTFYPTHVPLGVRQRAACDRWLASFGTFFKLQNPDHPVVEKGMEEVMASMLGQLWKLEFAATLPEADPHADFWTAGGGYEELSRESESESFNANLLIEPVSNWTPANCRVLELALHHAAKGDRVLIGSDIVLPGQWIVDELQKRGVKAGNTLQEGDGPAKTKTPAARAKIVEQFQSGEISVLVATCEALNLGHNLDEGTVAIINGLPWDFATFDQFIARIHRLTSKKDVKVYVIVPAGTLTERKWKLLVDKGAAAMLALDGRLIEQDEQHIDQKTILEQYKEAGVPVQGNEVDEDDLERAWLEIKSAADLPEIVLEGVGIEDLQELTEDEEADVEVEEVAEALGIEIKPDAEVETEPEHEWRVEFDVGEPKWCTNAMRYATFEEASEAGEAKFQAWTVPSDYRVVNEETPLGEQIDGADESNVAQEPTFTVKKAFIVPTREGGYVAVPQEYGPKDGERFDADVDAKIAAIESNVADDTSDSGSSPEPEIGPKWEPGALKPDEEPEYAGEHHPEPVFTPEQIEAITAEAEAGYELIESESMEDPFKDDLATVIAEKFLPKPASPADPAPAGGLGLF